VLAMTKFFSLYEAARICRVDARTLRELVDSGDVRCSCATTKGSPLWAEYELTDVLLDAMAATKCRSRGKTQIFYERPN
jgi:hypothetical protein